MTQDEIIRMFHEAGELAGWKPGVGNPLVINYLTHFAALVAAHEREKTIGVALTEAVERSVYAAVLAEREACAKVCDEIKGWPTEKVIADECAAAIRARGETK